MWVHFSSSFFLSFFFFGGSERQVHDKLRPNIPKHCPAPYAELMRACWHDDPAHRPTFTQILDMLRDIKSSGVVPGVPAAAAATATATTAAPTTSAGAAGGSAAAAAAASAPAAPTVALEKRVGSGKKLNGPLLNPLYPWLFDFSELSVGDPIRSAVTLDLFDGAHHTQPLSLRMRATPRSLLFSVLFFSPPFFFFLS
jgi:hypothetical protein